jgi:hypothetical protein
MKDFDALAFVRERGVVLLAARGPVPSLAEAVAGAPIRGSWWGHPAGRAIYAAAQRLADSPDVLCCRLVGGRITLVHRRLWPALVRLAEDGALPRRALAWVQQEHTASGRHCNRERPYPAWVPPDARAKADRTTAAAAWRALGIEPSNLRSSRGSSR